MRDRLRKFRSRFGQWLRLHRRGVLLVFWFFFFFTAGGGYLFLSQSLALPFINPLGLLTDEPLLILSSPENRDRPNPISGVFYSGEEAGAWDERRPLAVMIDNHALARPSQFGLQKADLIYEAVAEGGITRFLAVFHSQDVEKLGAVRSARVYYIDWALEFPAYYAHIGGASTPGSPANINAYIPRHDVLSLNQFRLGTSTYTFGGNVIFSGGKILSRLYYTSTAKLWEAGEKLYPGTNELPDLTSWKFKADRPFSERPETQAVTFSFGYLALYAGRWVYEPENNVYLREQGGEIHRDQATGEQISAKNVVLASMDERFAGDGTSHRLYLTTGEGNALLYRDGKRIPATWRRPFLSSRMRFFERGTDKELEFNRGLTWIEVIPR